MAVKRKAVYSDDLAATNFRDFDDFFKSFLKILSLREHILNLTNIKLVILQAIAKFAKL